MRCVASFIMGLLVVVTSTMAQAAASEDRDSVDIDTTATAEAAEDAGSSMPNDANHAAVGSHADRIETVDTVPPSTIEVRTVDANSMPVPGVHLELLRDRQSVAEGNSSSRQQTTSDASGQAAFSNVPSGRESQYRVVVVDAGTTYGTPLFALDARAGRKVLLHVYPLVKDFNQAMIAGRTMVFVEPRDDVLSIEFLHQFHNLGRSVMRANGTTLALPKGWKAFAANPTDPDLNVVRHAEGVELAGAIPPGQHTIVFTFQVPSSNRRSVEMELGLWQNTAEAQVATFARPGLELSVEGFPEPTLTQGNARQPLRVTGKALPRGDGTPATLHLSIAGLPVIGAGRWWAVALASALALWAVAFAIRGRASKSTDGHAAARARILDELLALEMAQRSGEVDDLTYSSTRELLLSAFVRIERETLTS